MKYIIVFCAILVTSTLVSFAQQPAPLGKLLSKSYAAMKDNDESIIIISLMDKGTQTLSASRPDNLVSARSLMRRAKVRASSNLVDDQDLPLEQSYVHAIEGGVLEVRYQLKWFNAVTARATKLQIQKLRDLPFVKEIDLVGKWKKTADEEVQSSPALPTKTQPRNVDVLNYGSSFTQLNQINVPAVHNLGIYGQGIVIGVFDNGVRLPNHEAFANMNIIATHDFVDHKTSVVPNDPDPGFGGHGVTTL